MHDLLSITNIMMSVGSTVALEAMIFNTPIILLNYEYSCPIPFAKYNSAISVEKSEDIEINIKKILFDKEVKKIQEKGREKFLKIYLGFKDGKSSNRVVNEILKNI